MTDKQLEANGVSKREFDLIKKLMKLNPEIFIEKGHFKTTNESPYSYTVDLSKYSDVKLPQELKEVLYRPQKLRTLKERYWAIASALDNKERAEDAHKYKKRWHPRKLSKEEEEYQLTDRVLATIDQLVQRTNEAEDKLLDTIDPKVAEAELMQVIEEELRNPTPSFTDGFSHHAHLIAKQVRDSGFCTKSQLEYLVLYNQMVEYDSRCVFSGDQLARTKIFKDRQQDMTREEKTHDDDMDLYGPLFEPAQLE